jgi:hypothetical protein
MDRPFLHGNYPLTVGTRNPYVDYRLGGVGRYFAPPRKDTDMRVPDEVLRCVVFIGREYGTAIKYIGTGFFVSLAEKEGGHTFRFTYLVTANHVADAVDGAPFWIRMNRKSGEAVEVAANESGDVKWFRHARGESVDVAVCELSFPSRDFDTLSVTTDMFLTKKIAEEAHIGAGDEVLLTGLFTKIKGNERNIPIVRMGNLAMAPNAPIVPTDLGDIEAYLIEVKSLGGISGSPVFIRQTIDIPGLFKWGTNIPATAQAYSNVIYLLGLAHGHWSIDPREINNPTVEHLSEGFNVGLAIVVPASHILELLHNQELIDMRKALKDGELAKHKGATMDSAVTENTFTKEDFEQALKKVSRKIERPGQK